MAAEDPPLSHFIEPCEGDIARADRLGKRLETRSRTETVRRALITLESLLNVQDNDGQIILCKKGQPDKVLWLL